MKAVVVGCEAAGKSLLLRQLRRFCLPETDRQESVDPNTRPTTGFETTKLEIPSQFSRPAAEDEPKGNPGNAPASSPARVTLQEVGSCFQARWARWLKDAACVVLVLDASSAAVGLADSMVAILDVMEATPPHCRGLIVLNKTDRSDRRTLIQLHQRLQLSFLEEDDAPVDVASLLKPQPPGRRWDVVEASALSGHNVPVVLAWLAEQVRAAAAPAGDPAG